MIVTCPNCSSRFVLPEAELGEAGRKVQCSECHTIWEQFEEDIGEIIVSQPENNDGEKSLDEALPDGYNNSEADDPVSGFDSLSETDDLAEDILEDEPVDDALDDDAIDGDSGDDGLDTPESDQVASADDIDALFGEGGGGDGDDAVEADADADADVSASDDDPDADDASDNTDPEGTSEVSDSEEDQSSEDAQGDTEIPDGVKPIKADLLDSRRFQSSGDSEREAKPFAGYAAAAAVFLVIFIGLMVLKGPITRSWPSAYAMYGMLGGVGAFPGEGLGFDRIEVLEDHGTYVLSGGIINFTKEDVIVPMIEVSLVSDHDEFIEKWYIEPPKIMLEPEDNIRFETRLERHKDDHGLQGKPGELSLRFVLVTRTDEGGDDSTHAPQQDDQAHPSDDEAPSKSPPHASSQPHQEHGH